MREDVVGAIERTAGWRGQELAKRLPIDLRAVLDQNEVDPASPAEWREALEQHVESRNTQEREHAGSLFHAESMLPASSVIPDRPRVHFGDEADGEPTFGEFIALARRTGNRAAIDAVVRWLSVNVRSSSFEYDWPTIVAEARITEGALDTMADEWARGNLPGALAA
jgi:hypothetical protein